MHVVEYNKIKVRSRRLSDKYPTKILINIYHSQCTLGLTSEGIKRNLQSLFILTVYQHQHISFTIYGVLPIGEGKISGYITQIISQTKKKHK